MILEIIPAGGIGLNKPVILAANQVLIRNDDGTIICVAVEIGDRGVAVEKVGDPLFRRLLRSLGVNESVSVQRLELPAPSGARLIHDPTVGD